MSKSKSKSSSKSNLVELSKHQKKSTNTPISQMAFRINQLKDEKIKLCEMAAKTILKALDAKDNYTYSHSIRVCHYSLILGRELNLSEQELYNLQIASLFHDIGKIATPEAVLNKPTRLTDEEFKIIQEHPARSAEILGEIDIFSEAAKFVKHHHERYDGRGYPSQLKGDEIPQGARIILITDTFDAMTSHRVYRKGLPFEVAYNELQEFSGTQFDPGLVMHFINGMRKEDEQGHEDFYIPVMDQNFKKQAA